MKHESDGITSSNWRTQNSHRMIGTRLVDMEISALVKTIQNTALFKSGRILRRFLET